MNFCLLYCLYYIAYNSFTSSKSLSMDDIRHIVMRSSKKSCSLDPVPTSLVVECMDELLPFILLHKKLLQFDWLRTVVFQLNLNYLHVKITNLLWVVV